MPKTIPIDGNLVREMSAKGFTLEQVADAIGCDQKTLQRRAMQYVRAGRAELGRTLRNEAVRIATDASHKQQTGMIQFLLERMDGLTRPAQEVTGAGGGPLEIRLTSAQSSPYRKR